MRKLILGALLGVLTACSQTSAQQARRQLPTEAVATVGGTPITLGEVDDKALEQPASAFGSAKLSQALYEARRAALDEIVANTLMDAAARAQGVDRAALVEKEITAKIPPVSETEVTSWFQANQARLQGAPLEQVKQPIRAYLIQERMQSIRSQYVDSLRAKTNVTIMLEPPRQVVSSANSPSKGPKTAPVELIEFSDFQCPYCLRADPTVRQVLATYGDKIRFVYRHYPLPSHPSARPAAEAAACAGEQGQFWPYHDLLFANPSKLSDADLKQHASALGLNTGQFNSCVDTHKPKGLIDADVKAGEEAGVNGTPAFYINGRMLSGAQPYDLFKRIIDEELERKRP